MTEPITSETPAAGAGLDTPSTPQTPAYPDQVLASPLSRISTVTWGLCVMLLGIWCLAVLTEVRVDWQLWVIGLSGLAGVTLLLAALRSRR